MAADAVNDKPKAQKDSNAYLMKRDSMFTWSKHKGKTVADVLEEAPSFILWAEDNVAFVKFDESVLTEAKQKDSLRKVNKAIAAPAPLISLVLDQSGVETDLSVIGTIYNGIDPVSNPNNIREVHGIGRNVNVHAPLINVQQILKYILQEWAQGRDAVIHKPGSQQGDGLPF